MVGARALPFTLAGLAAVLVAALVWHWPVGYSPVKHQTAPISVGLPAPAKAVPAAPARAAPAQPAPSAPAPAPPAAAPPAAAPPAAAQGPALAPAGSGASQRAGSSPALGYPGGAAYGPCQNPTTLAELKACGGG